MTIVELQHPTEVFCLFAADHPFRLADEAVAGGVTHFNAEILRLATLAQDTVTVNPAMLDIVNTVANHKQVDGMDELPIAYVREEVRLHDGDIAFPVRSSFAGLFPKGLKNHKFLLISAWIITKQGVTISSLYFNETKNGVDARLKFLPAVGSHKDAA